jgi:hypothetical protein
MARVPKISCKKFSFARRIQCYPLFLISFDQPASLYCEGYVYMYIYIYTHTHTPDCVQTVYQLPLLPNNTVSETFIHKLGEVRSVDWIFIFGVNT